MKQYKTLKVKYIGKSGKEIELIIEDFPDDQELIIAMTDSNYQADWKTELLDFYYEEKLNDRKQSRSDRHRSYEDISREDYKNRKLQKRVIESNIDVESQVLSKVWMDELSSILSDRQIYLIKRCLIDGESYSSIAHEEGKDESAIRKAVNRAKTKLKKYFQDRPN